MILSGRARLAKAARILLLNRISDMTTILLIVLILLLIGALPAWPYSSAWGYVPSGTLGLILLILIVLLLLGRI